MNTQDKYEPHYPLNEQECNAYCERLVTSLSSSLKQRLVCVLLSGSWATGDAKPPYSDVDLTVVVDLVDNSLLDDLCVAWKHAKVGYANVYGIEEIHSMSREALHMYTTNAVVLFGSNPFPLPNRTDFANDLMTVAEIVARMVRNAEYAYWLTDSEIKEELSYILGKTCLRRAFQNLAAFRTGRYPSNSVEHRAMLKDDPEHKFITWLENLSESELILNRSEIIRTINSFVVAWFREVAEYRGTH